MSSLGFEPRSFPLLSAATENKREDRSLYWELFYPLNYEEDFAGTAAVGGGVVGGGGGVASRISVAPICETWLSRAFQIDSSTFFLPFSFKATL